MAWGATGESLAVKTAISAFGNVNGDVLATSRLFYAGALNGIFPKFLGKIHPKYQTPYWAIITFGSLIFLFTMLGGFQQLLTLASGSLLLIYLAVVLSVIKLRMKKTVDEKKSFKMPGGLTIPIIAIVAIVYVLSNLSKQEITSISVFLAIVCVIYFLMKKMKSSNLKIGNSN